MLACLACPRKALELVNKMKTLSPSAEDEKEVLFRKAGSYVI